MKKHLPLLSVLFLIYWGCEEEVVEDTTPPTVIITSPQNGSTVNEIVIITCVFEPEPVVSARIAKDLASELAESGHRVLVVCPFPSRPKGKIFDGYSRRGWDNVFSDTGFSVLRVLTFVSKSSSFVSRFFENISFGNKIRWRCIDI